MQNIVLKLASGNQNAAIHVVKDAFLVHVRFFKIIKTALKFMKHIDANAYSMCNIFLQLALRDVANLQFTLMFLHQLKSIEVKPVRFDMGPRSVIFSHPIKSIDVKPVRFDMGPRSVIFTQPYKPSDVKPVRFSKNESSSSCWFSRMKSVRSPFNCPSLRARLSGFEAGWLATGLARQRRRPSAATTASNSATKASDAGRTARAVAQRSIKRAPASTSGGRRLSNSLKCWAMSS